MENELTKVADMLEAGLPEIERSDLLLAADRIALVALGSMTGLTLSKALAVAAAVAELDAEITGYLKQG